LDSTSSKDDPTQDRRPLAGLAATRPTRLPSSQRG
jgi:hypothetical protein